MNIEDQQYLVEDQVTWHNDLTEKRLTKNKISPRLSGKSIFKTEVTKTDLWLHFE